MTGDPTLEERRSTDQGRLVAEIEDFCRRAGIAESTFGKQAVNDGKFVNRLRIGHSVTARTAEAVRKFIAERQELQESKQDIGGSLHSVVGRREKKAAVARTRSFFSPARHAALLQYTNESGRIAERVFGEVDQLEPTPPALRMHYARLDDGRVLDTSLKYVHHRYPKAPIVTVARELDYSNTLKALLRFSDRLQEHQEMILVLTNLPISAAARLGDADPALRTVAVQADWLDFPIEGMDSFEMHSGMAKIGVALQPYFHAMTHGDRKLQDRAVRYYVAVLYLKHMRFALDHLIPNGPADAPQFDLIVASHSYRLAVPTKLKAERVLKPLVDALAPGGRLLAVHAHGEDCALEFVKRIWPDFGAFPVSRHELITATRELIADPRNLTFSAGADRKAIFDYTLRWPEEASFDLSGSVATELGWMICSHVAQIPDSLITDARKHRPGEMEEAVQTIGKSYARLWFLNESFTVHRRRETL